MAKDYVYDYGYSSREKEEEAEIILLPSPTTTTTAATTTTASSIDVALSFNDTSSPDFYFPGLSSSSSSSFPPSDLLPHPLGIIVSVLVPVGILVNLSSLCHCRRLTSPFLSLGFSVVAVCHAAILVCFLISVALPGN